MNKSDSGRITGGDDGGVAKAVKTAIGTGQSAVDRVRCLPTSPVVVSPLPFHTADTTGFAIGRANADALATAELLQRQGFVHFLVEAAGIHPADDSEAGTRIGPRTGLAQQVARRASLAESDAVDTHTLLAAP